MPIPRQSLPVNYTIRMASSGLDVLQSQFYSTSWRFYIYSSGLISLEAPNPCSSLHKYPRIFIEDLSLYLFLFHQ